MRYFSMFSGIGGFEIALNELGHDCIGFSEIDKYAIQIYQQHFPDHKNYGDATRIIPEQLPDFDLLCGGFPCQAFSIAGKRGGFEDTRGTLFFDIARIARVKRPRYLFLENVKGLLSHDEGNTFATIIGTIDELGYDCQWQVLNSKNFGVPQNRERVFIVGHLRGTPRPEIFPLGENSEPDIVLPALTTRYYGGQANGGYIGNKPKQIIGGRQGSRVYDTGGVSPTLASQTGEFGGKTGLYMVADPSRKKGIVKSDIAPTLRSETHGNLPAIAFKTNTKLGYDVAKEGDGINLAFPESKTRRGRVIKKNSPTLQANSQIGTIQGMKIRRLTPTECERLQAYPDGWTEGISDNQRYKTLGNGVTVDVIREIAKRII
jgi:DNA (cytosine-5)-methyltransferase 1